MFDLSHLQMFYLNAKQLRQHFDVGQVMTGHQQVMVR